MYPLAFYLYSPANVVLYNPPREFLCTLSENFTRLESDVGNFDKSFIAYFSIPYDQLQVFELFRKEWKATIVIVIPKILFIIICA